LWKISKLLNIIPQSKSVLINASAINQQIALKTIKKLGFHVSAVWNGKEALDYLLASDQQNATHPKPDIIFMDVQMPVLDGYRATHVIRHHEPYKITSRQIPIVAMTASAIQGDREKCKKAGMDDYLAKPVKGKTLEKMIIKWATSRRDFTTFKGSDYADSECSQDPDCTEESRPGVMKAPSAKSGSSTTTTPTLERAVPRPSLAERQNSHRLILPGTETEGDRLQKRSEAEEKALSLRDDKLVGLACGPGDGFLPHDKVRADSQQQLTIENVGKLAQETRGLLKREDSMAADAGTDSDAEPVPRKSERPTVSRQWRSDKTVKPAN